MWLRDKLVGGSRGNPYTPRRPIRRIRPLDREQERSHEQLPSACASASRVV
jgi:hypothetical protein